VFSGVCSLFKRDAKGPGDCWSGVVIVEEVDGVGDKGSGDTTIVNLETVLEAFLENVWTLELFSSTAEVSGFLEYQLD
jgi:hypothetical protein